MPRIQPVAPEKTAGKVQTQLAAIGKKLGVVPNLMKTLARSPAALDGYLGLSGALAAGKLRTALREQIALTVAERNSCDYCLAAHTALGAAAGLDEAAILAARRGEAADLGAAAALRFARAVVDARGGVSDAALEAARAAGLGEGDLIEIVAHVALNVLTNYVNRVAQTDVDFPQAPVLETKAA
jgi:uncharacterized peroxidase-related enzyme